MFKVLLGAAASGPVLALALIYAVAVAAIVVAWVLHDPKLTKRAATLLRAWRRRR